MSRRRLFRVLAAVLLITGCLASLWICRAPVLTAMAHWLDVGEEPRPVDAVLMLPGDQLVRPLVAAALVRAGLAERVLVPANVVGADVADGLRPEEHEITRAVLKHRGLSDAQIVILPDRSATTQTDIHAAARYLARAHQQRLALVTSHYHTRRARWLCHRHLGAQGRQVVIVSAPVDDYTLDDWWRHDEGVEAIVSEYVKLAEVASGSWTLRASVGFAVALLVGVWLVRARAKRRR